MNVRCFCALLLLLIAACAPQPRAEPIPTVMALPTLTPTDEPTRTPRPTLTFTLAPSNTPVPATETPDLVQTQFAALNATNAAAQSTLAALQTQLASTGVAQTGGAITAAPSAEVPAAAPPSPTATLDPVVPMPLTTLYARDVTPLRTCADRSCEALQLLSPGIALVVNGSLSGDMIENGNNLWYRADFAGQAVYVYSGYLMSAAPTPIQIFQPEMTPPVLPPPAQSVCPRNCTEAVAWGYSAQQAAACGLDRDGDGVACYGD